MITPQSGKFFKKRDFSEKNISNFNKSLGKCNWNSTNGTNFENSFSTFQNLFSENFLISFPENHIKIKYNNRLPYLTNGLRKSIERKHVLKHIYTKTPSERNLLNCKIFNNKLTSLLRKREQEYIEEQLDIHKTDIAKSWKIIKEIVGKKQK